MSIESGYEHVHLVTLNSLGWRALTHTFMTGFSVESFPQRKAFLCWTQNANFDDFQAPTHSRKVEKNCDLPDCAALQCLFFIMASFELYD